MLGSPAVRHDQLADLATDAVVGGLLLEGLPKLFLGDDVLFDQHFADPSTACLGAGRRRGSRGRTWSHGLSIGSDGAEVKSLVPTTGKRFPLVSDQ
jgi:hypothetical protein